MVVAVVLSYAGNESIEANRRPAKNYYRDAFMARRPRGKVSLPETFREPSSWLITFDTFATENLPESFREIPESGNYAFLRAKKCNKEIMMKI